MAEKNEFMEEGKPVPEDTIMAFTVINNRTDKEYKIISANECGLEIVSRDGRISFFQKYEKKASEPQGVFIDFSVVKTTWKYKQP